LNAFFQIFLTCLPELCLLAISLLARWEIIRCNSSNSNSCSFFIFCKLFSPSDDQLCYPSYDWWALVHIHFILFFCLKNSIAVLQYPEHALCCFFCTLGNSKLSILKALESNLENMEMLNLMKNFQITKIVNFFFSRCFYFW